MKVIFWSPFPNKAAEQNIQRVAESCRREFGIQVRVLHNYKKALLRLNPHLEARWDMVFIDCGSNWDYCVEGLLRNRSHKSASGRKPADGIFSDPSYNSRKHLISVQQFSSIPKSQQKKIGENLPFAKGECCCPQYSGTGNRDGQIISREKPVGGKRKRSRLETPKNELLFLKRYVILLHKQRRVIFWIQARRYG